MAVGTVPATARGRMELLPVAAFGRALGGRWGGFAAGAAAAVLLGCTPPEAERVRGGGPGADPGNRDAVVEMHGGSAMYWETPCRTTVEPQCPGPLPVAGLPERDEVVRRWGG